MSDVKTALLVDDNDELRGATGEYLEEIGYAVTAAADAEEALRLAQVSEERFDLLVSDVVMPGMNGIELADRLLARAPELAVLLISSHGGEPDVRRRLAEGDVAFLAKPFSPEEMASGISDAFDRAAARRMDGPEAASASGGDPEAVPAAAGERQPVSTASQPRLPRGTAQVLVAIALVLGLGALIRGFESGPPPLPAAPPDATQRVTRSATLEVLQPLGSVAAAPAELSWLAIEGASSYAVSLRALDGQALWKAEVTRSPANLPPEIVDGLHRAVTYYWSVEALDTERKLVARSELAPFAIELAGQTPP